MNRLGVFLAAAAAAAFAFVGSVNPAAAQFTPNIVATTLWDNNTAGAVAFTYPGSGAILCCTNSQNQSPSYPTATDQAADDFTVAAGQQWSVSGVNVPGSVFNAGSTPSTFNVYIYQDNAGVPGSTVTAQFNIAPSNSSPSNASPNLPLSTVILSAGTYWISVQANGSGFRWYWDDTPTASGSLYNAKFQQPGGYDFSSPNPCATWAARYSCISDSGRPDQAFVVLGTVNSSLSVYNGNVTTTGTEGVTPASNGYYLGSFQNSLCNGTTNVASDYTGAITWNGSGTGSNAATIVSHATPNLTCVFDVYGSYTYYTEANYHPTVKITENSSSATVSLAPTLAISEAGITANAAPSNSACTLFASCSINAASFTDANKYCNLEQANPYVQYTATVNFGDGTTAASNASGTGAVHIAETGNPCVVTVTATHLYSSTGSKVVTTTLCDESNSTCATTSSPASAPTVVVGTPSSTPPSNHRLSVFTINYQHVTPYPNYTNFTVGLTEYHYSSGANIANLNYYNTPQGIVLNYCATRNAALTQCRAHVLSFTCTATTATLYLSYQLPNQTTLHYAELYGNSATQTFSVTTDNGAGSIVTASPSSPPPANTVRIYC